MKCTKCNCPTRVKDTMRLGSPRPKAICRYTLPVERHRVSRIRQCRACGHKFETVEEPVSTTTGADKITEILQLVAPALIGMEVRSLSSATSFTVDRVDAIGVHSDLDPNCIGLWLEHGNYALMQPAKPEEVGL